MRQADGTSPHLLSYYFSLRWGIMTPSYIPIPIKAEARQRAGNILLSQTNASTIRRIEGQLARSVFYIIFKSSSEEVVGHETVNVRINKEIVLK